MVRVIAIHLEVKRNFNSFPMWGRILQGRIAVHLRGRNLNSFPLWGEFVWKDSCCCGEIALHLRLKNFKIDCSFPSISNRWRRIALHLGITLLNIQKLLLFSNG